MSMVQPIIIWQNYFHFHPPYTITSQLVVEGPGRLSDLRLTCACCAGPPVWRTPCSGTVSRRPSLPPGGCVTRTSCKPAGYDSSPLKPNTGITKAHLSSITRQINPYQSFTITEWDADLFFYCVSYFKTNRNRGSSSLSVDEFTNYLRLAILNNAVLS